jgi:hypothetical protein
MTRGGPPAWGLGENITTTHHKNEPCYEQLTIKAWTWTEILVRPKQRKRDMRFGNWNARNLYSAGSFTAAVRELAR